MLNVLRDEDTWHSEETACGAGWMMSLVPSDGYFPHCVHMASSNSVMTLYIVAANWQEHFEASKSINPSHFPVNMIGTDRTSSELVRSLNAQYPHVSEFFPISHTFSP